MLALLSYQVETKIKNYLPNRIGISPLKERKSSIFTLGTPDCSKTWSALRQTNFSKKIGRLGIILSVPYWVWILIDSVAKIFFKRSSTILLKIGFWLGIQCDKKHYKFNEKWNFKKTSLVFETQLNSHFINVIKTSEIPLKYESLFPFWTSLSMVFLTQHAVMNILKLKTNLDKQSKKGLLFFICIKSVNTAQK